MDTQRLILFVIFAFSALFLWERWQSEHRPPVPPPAVQPAPPATGVGKNREIRADHLGHPVAEGAQPFR